jgi:pyruvate dehydrogenase E1 component beta subunit
MAGLRPVAEMMRMDFALPAYDQIAQHAAKIRYMFGGQFQVPMVIRGPSGVGNQLSAQHSQALDVLFAHIPGLKGCRARHARRRQGPDQGGHPRQ